MQLANLAAAPCSRERLPGGCDGRSCAERQPCVLYGASTFLSGLQQPFEVHASLCLANTCAGQEADRAAVRGQGHGRLLLRHPLLHRGGSQGPD